jgi:excisionase family DNA binding protein
MTGRGVEMDEQTGKRPWPRLHQAAAELEIADQVARRLLKNGVLRGYKVGREYRIDPDSIDAIRRGGTGKAA